MYIYVCVCMCICISNMYGHLCLCSVCLHVCMHTHLRVRALPPLISCRQVVTLFHQNIESTGFVAVADVQQDLAAHPGVAIVTSLTVHAHHAVYTTLLGRHSRQRGRCES